MGVTIIDIGDACDGRCKCAVGRAFNNCGPEAHIVDQAAKTVIVTGWLTKFESIRSTGACHRESKCFPIGR